jgi:hypothetical protein
MSNLALHDLRDGIQLLVAAGYVMPKVDRDEIASAWQRVLGGYSLQEFRAGLDTFLRSDAKYWPKPGQILREIDRLRFERGETGRKGLAAAYWDWEKSGKTGPCPVCGAVIEFRPGQRSAVYHDHQQHYEKYVGYCGPRTGPVVDGKMLPADAHETTKAIRDDAPPF